MDRLGTRTPRLSQLFCVLALALFLHATLSTPALGSIIYAPPVPMEYRSTNGNYLFTTKPPDLGDGFWLKNYVRSKLDGSYSAQCSGTLWRVEGDTKTVVWAQRLENDLAPLDVLVSDDGQYVVTLDNWRVPPSATFPLQSEGYGDNLVVAYGPAGNRLFKLGLEELFKGAQPVRFPVGYGSRLWRDAVWLDGERLVISAPTDGQMMLRVIDLDSGLVRQGVDDDLRRALSLPDTPREALDLLAIRPQLETRGALQTIHRDQTSPLAHRLRAAVALDSLGAAEGAELFRWASRNAPEESDRVYAISNLPRMLPEDALSLLVAILDNADSYDVRRASGSALAELGQVAVPALRGILFSGSPQETRVTAADTLGALDGPQAVDALLTARKDTDRRVVTACFFALTRSQEPRARLGLVDWLAEGSALDERIVRHFSEARCEAVIGPVMKSWARHLDWSPWKQSRFARALRLQTGADFGAEREVWAAWLKSRDSKTQVDLGDPAGFLYPEPDLEKLSRWPRLIAWLETEKGVKDVTVSEGRILALASWAAWLELDLQTGTPQKRFPDAKALNITHPPTKRAVRIANRAIEVWDTDRAERLSSPHTKHLVSDVKFSESGTYFVATGPEWGALWRTEGAELLFSLDGLALASEWLVDPTESVVAIHARDSIELRNLDGELVTRLATTGASMAWSPNGKVLAVWSNDGLQIFERSGRRLSSNIPAQFDWQLEFIPTHDMMVLVGRGKLQLISYDGAVLRVLPRAEKFALSPDRKTLAVTDSLNEITLYDFPELRRRVSLRKRLSESWPCWEQVLFSEDGQHLLAHFDGYLACWDLRPTTIPTGVNRGLLVELWTGLKLRDGTPTALTPAEYSERVQKWNHGDWTKGDSVVQDSD